MRGIDIPPFYAGEIGALAAARSHSGLEVIAMHFGQPTEGTPPSALAAASLALESRSSGYWESQPLKERIALYYDEHYGVRVTPDRVLLTTGASAGLVAAFTALFAAGDRVAISRPGYPAYRNALLALGRVPFEIDCGAEHGYRLSPSLLPAEDVSLQGLLVASPANPTGAMLSADQLGALAEACWSRGARLLSDEIYHGIEYVGTSITALSIDPEAVVINSFSKLFRMPGWRMGWLVAPQSCVARLRSHLINFFLTPPSLSQQAALAAFDDLALLRKSVDLYAENRRLLLADLPSMGLRNIAAPDGAFYLYLDVGHLTSDSLGFCRRLLNDTGIALAPGIDFDVLGGHSHVRLSFAVSRGELLRALELLGPWTAEQARTTHSSADPSSG